jgi:hypothetical protein
MYVFPIHVYMYIFPIHVYMYIFPIHKVLWWYSKTCLNQASLGLIFVFAIDRCSLYTGYFKKDFLYWDFIYSLYRIPFYWGFGLDRFHCDMNISIYITS